MAASFRIESTVCSHHDYKATWSPYTGEELLVQCEVGNIQDNFVVAILKNDMIIDHGPQESIGTSCMQKNGSLHCQ